SELVASPPWPEWNPTIPGASGCVEFHLDTASLPQTPWPGWNPALPGATGSVEFHLDTARLPQTPRPGWNPALPGATGSVEFHLDTACWQQPPGPGGNPPLPDATAGRSPPPPPRPGRNLHGRDGTRPSQARPECRVPPRHSVLAANPMAGMEPGPPRRDLNVEFHLDTPSLQQPHGPGWNPALPGATGSVEFHLDTARLPKNPTAGMEPGPPRIRNRRKSMPHPLWTPSREQIAASRMDAFRRQVNQQFGLSLADYAQLHEWSMQERADFWQALVAFFQVQFTTPPSRILEE